MYLRLFIVAAISALVAFNFSYRIAHSVEDAADTAATVSSKYLTSVTAADIQAASLSTSTIAAVQRVTDPRQTPTVVPQLSTRFQHTSTVNAMSAVDTIAALPQNGPHDCLASTTDTNRSQPCSAILKEIGLLYRSAGNLVQVRSEGHSLASLTPAASQCTVTSAADNTGAGTLRRCLTNATVATAINFSPQTFPPASPVRIQLVSPLPTITQNGVKVDASNAGVILDGSQLQRGNCIDKFIDGLVVNGADSVTIQGLLIIGFPGDGIVLFNGVTGASIGGDRASGNGPLGQGNLISGNQCAGVRLQDGATSENQILGNFIGTTLDGAATVSGQAIGIALGYGAHHNRIGGNTPTTRNLISGNAGFGISLMQPKTTHNQVAGNLIGVALNGVDPLPNGFAGVWIDLQASQNTIGGENNTARNIISGNDLFGIIISGTQTINNAVIGNYIGVAADGMTRRGNKGWGVVITAGASGNVIGSEQAAFPNIISGNEGTGIQIEGEGTSNNRIVGNYIGTNIHGTSTISNTEDGIYIGFGATDNLVGGPSREERNLISGNRTSGIQIDGEGTTNNRVVGNYIGTNVSGTATISNTGDGVYISFGAIRNIIGGTSTTARNLISGNRLAGVALEGAGVVDNEIMGNFIGVDATGTYSLSNLDAGVYIGVDVKRTIVGGSIPGARNLISGNARVGVSIEGPNISDNRILGNFIGVDSSGSQALPNYQGILLVDGAKNNMIGGAQPGEGNVISGNASFGIGLTGEGTEGNQILGNLVGTDVTGTQPVGNGQIGILFGLAATNNIVGGTTSGARNIVSANRDFGIQFLSPECLHNRVQGNYIGTDITGSANLGNGSNGVAILNSACNTIGGTEPGAGNVISHNGGSGIDIIGSKAMSNTIAGNIIGPIAAGTSSFGAQEQGIAMINGANHNRIGGTTPAERNLISGNTGAGIHIQGQATNYNQVLGNYIGTTADGRAALANGQFGVAILSGSQYNQVGAAIAGASNLISGNAQAGVAIQGAEEALTAYNQIIGNWIGVAASGEQALGNGQDGVLIFRGAQANLVGGEASGAGNLISANGEMGVRLADPGTTGNQVVGNLIGLNQTGERTLGIQHEGIHLEAGTANNLIGGLSIAARNVIGGHVDKNYAGIHIRDVGTDENRVIGNYIGVDATGKLARPNDLGVVIVNGARRNRIGGDEPGAGNLISGNRVGVVVEGAETVDNRIQGNWLGTDNTGLALLGNSSSADGIALTHCATANLIGGETPGSRNVIVGQSNSGIAVQDTCSVSNRIFGNYVGVASDGHQPLGNGIGIRISFGARNTLIGGERREQQNLISANLLAGIMIHNLPPPTAAGTTAQGQRAVAINSANRVAGNIIGAPESSQATLGNAGIGLILLGGTQGNIIGISNTIAFNLAAGIVISDATTTGNTITRNTIHHNAGLPIEWQGGPEPIATSFITLTGYLTATHTVVGRTCPACRVELFAADTTVPAATLYQGAVDAQADGTFSLVLPAAPPLPFLFATVTLPDGTTAELVGGLDIRQLASQPPTQRLFLPMIHRK